MSDDPSVISQKQFRLTRDEAARRIRTAPSGTRFCLHINMHVHIADSEDYYPNANRTSITVSRAQAERICSEYISDAKEAEGRRIPLAINKYRSVVDATKVNTYYWIG